METVSNFFVVIAVYFILTIASATIDIETKLFFYFIINQDDTDEQGFRIVWR